MTMEYVHNYINNKIYQNSNFIKFTYYELRIKENLSERDIESLINLATTRLKNNNYLVYKTGEVYSINEEIKKVEDNELLIAIKIF